VTAPLRQFELPWSVVGLVIWNHTSATVALNRPVTTRGRRGRDEEVVEVRFWADDSRALVGASRARLAAAHAQNLGDTVGWGYPYRVFGGVDR